jgi:hypothetical protein
VSTELSGVHLASQALVAAREAAKKNGATQTKKPKRRTGTVVRRDGRDPLGLGAAIGMMMTERGMVAPAAGGSVLAQFDDILAAAAPELAGHVQAVAFDADTGRLDVVPDAPAYGTQLRWSAPKLVAAANAKVQGANVRTLNVLAPAPVKAGPATAAADPTRPTVSAAPVQRRTRRTATAVPSKRTARPPGRPGHRRSGGAANRRDAGAEPPRVPRAGRRPGRRAGSIEVSRAQRRRQAAATEAAALRRACAEKAGRQEAASRRLEQTA